MGNGQREFELVAAGIPDDFALGDQFGQSGANLGGANATEFLQLLNRDGVADLSQGLAHPLGRSGSRLGLYGGTFDYLQGHDRA